MKILLASQSPRRKELLQHLGFPFETVTTNVEEIFPEDLEPFKVPGFLSRLKAGAFRKLNEDEILLTADTVVILNNKILGKPQSEEEAVAMILELSGKTHAVVTAVSIKTNEDLNTVSDVAEVRFDDISEEEARHYVKEFKPLDKAGAYGIQEWLGMAKITEIKGSFYTIMGLPTHLVYAELKNFFPQ